MAAKPRLFVGSSTEGLAIANAVQTNLWRNAEVTIWTQGVFRPSSGTLVAILDALESQDFGVFVFSPDDVSLIRGTEHVVVRDNVLFELGIFVGRLGIDRSFFLLPDGSNIHLATDLFGITPLTYEVGRTDGNQLAAAGPASTQIAGEVQRLGFSKRLNLATAGASPTADDRDAPDSQQQLAEAVVEKPSPETLEAVSSTETEPPRVAWFEAYVNDDFALMQEELEAALIKAESSEEKVTLAGWRAYSVFMANPAAGQKAFAELHAADPLNAFVYHIAILALTDRDQLAEALQTADRALAAGTPERGSFLGSKARTLVRLSRLPEAISMYEQAIAADPASPPLYTSLAKLHVEANQFDAALRVLERGRREMPREKAVLEAMAVLLTDHFDQKTALPIYNALVRQHPNDASVVTRRGNLYLELGLTNLALEDYLKADKLTDGREAWIAGNIGNIFKNVGLYDRAVERFEAALVISPRDQYAHDRLAGALKQQQDEAILLKAHTQEGRALLRQLLIEPPTASSAPITDT